MKSRKLQLPATLKAGRTLLKPDSPSVPPRYIPKRNAHTASQKALTSMLTVVLYFLNWSTVAFGFPSGSAVKNLPAVQESQEAQVRSLGWEDSWRRTQ